MQGVVPHISEPKIKTAFITALNKVPDTCVIYPSRPKILVSLSQFLHAFRRFLTTTVQSLYEAVRIRPRHLNYGIKLSGRPYAWKYRLVLSRISFTAILCRFRFPPFLNYVVLGWRPFNTVHGNRMSQQVHRGWGRLNYSTMITVSCMFRCRKCTRRPVLVSALILNPYTGQYSTPTSLGK